MGVITMTAVAETPEHRLDRVCGTPPGELCHRILDITDSEFLAKASPLIKHGYHVVIIVVVAVVVRFLVGRLIRRVVRTTADGRVNRQLRALGEAVRLDISSEAVARRAARARTIGSVLTSVANVAIGTIAVILVLGELGINLAPIIASAGIVGVALGFGAQNVVKDFLSGLFLVLEDQYGVGDVITVDTVTGTVESVGLRSTRVRDVRGTLWHLRNGEVSQVGNITQGWSRIVFDVLVDHRADIATARTVLLDVGRAVAAEPAFVNEIEDAPSVWGVEEISLDGVALRLAIKTTPAVKDDLARQLRERALAGLREAGVPLAVRWEGADAMLAGSAGHPQAAPAKATPAKATPAKATPAKATPAKATPARAPRKTGAR